MSVVHGKSRRDFLENTIYGLLKAIERAFYADEAAARSGLLQKFDPKAKLVGMVVLIAAVNFAGRLWVIAILLCGAVLLALFSRMPIRYAFGSVWVSAATFSGAIAVPALFLTPGESVLRLPNVNMDVTAQGVRTAVYLVLRAETCSTLAMLLAFSTPWTHVLKALRVLRVPVVFVVILGMTFRYILLLMETACEMFESRRSRSVGHLGRGDYRRLAIATTGVLLAKSFQLGTDVFLAMQSRGFRGEVCLFDEFRMTTRDWVAMSFVTIIALAAVWVGR